MALFFTADGNLDISRDPGDLTGTVDDRGNVVSGEMQRCRNLRTTQKGRLITRDGCAKLSQQALDQTAIRGLAVHGGGRFAFAGTKIYRNEDAIATDLTEGDNWSTVQYAPYNSSTQSLFAVDGVNRYRIQGSTAYAWGIAAPTVAPTIEAGASTGLTGDYNAVYTYCRKEGSTLVSESDPSPAAAAAVTLSNKSFKATWTASSDSQVTHVRVYRTLTGGSVYYYQSETAIGTVTADSTVADTALGSEVETDHDRPPTGEVVIGPTYNGTLFMIDGYNLHYCKPKQPDYWPSDYYLEVSTPQDPGTALVTHNGQVYFFTKRSIFYIQGTGHTTFFPLPMESITGAMGPACAVTVHGKGIYHVGTDGLYLYSGSDKNITLERFAPLFRQESKNGMPAAVNLENSWLIQWRNQLYFGYCGSNADFAYCHDWESALLSGTGLHWSQTDATNSTEDSYTWESSYPEGAACCHSWETTEHIGATATVWTQADTADSLQTAYTWEIDYSTATTDSSAYVYAQTWTDDSLASDEAVDTETYRGPQTFDSFPTNALVLNLDTDRWTYYSWPMEIRVVTVDAANDRLIAGDSDGYLWTLEDASTATDGEASVAWELQTKDYTLQTRRHFPRWIKYDVDAAAADSATGTVILDGTDYQQHTLSSRSAKRRLIATGNGQRCSIKLSGTGPVEIFAMEAE